MTSAERAVFIRILLLQRGRTQTEIARGLGLPKQSINAVLHGRERTRRIQEAIARAVGFDVDELFPSDRVCLPPQPMSRGGNTR